jgi:hypothetical protein
MKKKIKAKPHAKNYDKTSGTRDPKNQQLTSDKRTVPIVAIKGTRHVIYDLAV